MSETTDPISGEITQDDFEAAQQRLEKQRESNVELVRELARYNKGVSPVEAQQVLFQTFLDTFLSDEDRLALEINFEYRMGILLEKAVSIAKRQQLMEGVAGANNLLGK